MPFLKRMASPLLCFLTTACSLFPSADGRAGAGSILREDLFYIISPQSPMVLTMPHTGIGTNYGFNADFRLAASTQLGRPYCGRPGAFAALAAGRCSPTGCRLRSEVGKTQGAAVSDRGDTRGTIVLFST